MKQPPVDELVQKFHDQLREYGWYDFYRFFDFRLILEQLGTDFCPKFKLILEPFSLIVPNQVRKVLIESYGVPPFYDIDYRLPYDADKRKLLEVTGIELDQRQWKNTLILPINLTNARDKRKKHVIIWQEFISYTIDKFNQQDNIIWLLSGWDAWRVRDYIRDQRNIFEYHSLCMRKAPCPGDMFKMLEYKEPSERKEGSI